MAPKSAPKSPTAKSAAKARPGKTTMTKTTKTTKTTAPAPAAAKPKTKNKQTKLAVHRLEQQINQDFGIVLSSSEEQKIMRAPRKSSLVTLSSLVVKSHLFKFMSILIKPKHVRIAIQLRLSFQNLF